MLLICVYTLPALYFSKDGSLDCKISHRIIKKASEAFKKLESGITEASPSKSCLMSMNWEFSTPFYTLLRQGLCIVASLKPLKDSIKPGLDGSETLNGSL